MDTQKIDFYHFLHTKKSLSSGKIKESYTLHVSIFIITVFHIVTEDFKFACDKVHLQRTLIYDSDCNDKLCNMQAISKGQSSTRVPSRLNWLLYFKIQYSIQTMWCHNALCLSAYEDLPRSPADQLFSDPFQQDQKTVWHYLYHPSLSKFLK